MENIKGFSDFLFEKKITEKAGISPAIYKDLEEYFKTAGRVSHADAQKFIAKKKKGWKLSKEDFSEALQKFRFKKK